ncbi:MAG: hypothetical protein QW303_02955 [Nitrososphaerota archaeon]
MPMLPIDPELLKQLMTNLPRNISNTNPRDDSYSFAGDKSTPQHVIKPPEIVEDINIPPKVQTTPTRQLIRDQLMRLVFLPFLSGKQPPQLGMLQYFWPLLFRPFNRPMKPMSVMNDQQKISALAQAMLRGVL